jgi:hypothetical protein
MAKVREATDKLLEMVEEGVLDRDTVIMACVKYMSEDDVADMCRANEFFETCAQCGDSVTELYGADLCSACKEAEDEVDDKDDDSEPEPGSDLDRSEREAVDRLEADGGKERA